MTKQEIDDFVAKLQAGQHGRELWEPVLRRGAELAKQVEAGTLPDSDREEFERLGQMIKWGYSEFVLVKPKP